MPEVKDYSGYTLGDLKEAVKKPWREFAEWLDKRLPPPLDRWGNKNLGQYKHGFHHPNGIGPYQWPYSADDWIDLAWEVWTRFHPQGNWIDIHDFYEFVFGKDAKWKPGQKESWLLATSDRRKKLSSAIRTLILWKKNGQPIDKRVRKIFRYWPAENLAEDLYRLRWCRWILREPYNHERFFWVFLRDKVRKELPKFFEIAQAIKRKEPLSEKQRKLLVLYTSIGQVTPTVTPDERDSITVENQLEASWYNTEAPYVYDHMEALLAPVAYKLSVAWEKSQPWPRFIITCHNPACGKKFYSALPNRVACPRRKEELGPSKCKRGWDNYRKWLKNICEAEGTNPEKVWDKPQRKKEFLKTWRPRGPQSPHS